MKFITALFILISTHFLTATFNIPNGNVAPLITAINSANTNGQLDIIILASNGTYNFTDVIIVGESPQFFTL